MAHFGIKLSLQYIDTESSIYTTENIGLPNTVKRMGVNFYTNLTITLIILNNALQFFHQGFQSFPLPVFA